MKFYLSIHERTAGKDKEALPEPGFEATVIKEITEMETISIEKKHGDKVRGACLDCWRMNHQPNWI